MQKNVFIKLFPRFSALLLLASCAARSSAASTEAPSGLPSFAPSTAPVTVELVLRRFEDFDRALDSLSADFRQFVRWDESGTAQSVEGSLQYVKPDRLRIEQRLPEGQTIVGDGLWLWIWRRSTNQVIQARFEDWKRSEPMAQGLLDFGKYGELLKRYEVSIATVTAADARGQREIELHLRPKPAEKTAEFELRLRLSTRDYFPVDTQLRAGQVTIHSMFTNVRFNPAIPPERFRFTPPPGADVFQNFKPPRMEQP